MPESDIAWTRVFVVFLVLLLGAASLTGIVVYSRFAHADSPAAGADGQTLTQIQKQLTIIEDRLSDLESHPKRSKRTSRELDEPERGPALQTHSNTPRHDRTQYRVSPPSAVASQPASAPMLIPDPASAQKLAAIQQGLGALEEQASSNREAWQATTNRLAEVAGELGAQHGQIIQNRDQLDRFLGRTEHTAVTFEIRRGSDPESVGPIRIALKSTNEKSQKYMICVYFEKSCLTVRDRVPYEVVQLAVSRDIAPLELIATKVDRDGIVGYLEVPGQYPKR
jgi:hypothetical protein